MCGRTACTLAPDEVCKACSVRGKGSDGRQVYRAPAWQDHPGSHTYSPSTNMAPSRFTPIMISDRHLRGVKRDEEGEETPPQRVIQPMMWGLIPFFYKGDSASGYGFKTNNCRLEDVEEKNSYKPSLKKGQRCVVLCDGFYEWQTTKGSKNKQPYFIYAPQPKGMEVWNRASWEGKEVWSEEEGWKGPHLLKMAGLFSRWTSTEGEEVLTYTVITKAAGKKFSGLHHRVPAILETDQEVEDWLDYGRVNNKEALAMLQKEEQEVMWHPVSTAVNNSRNQEPTLTTPVNPDAKPPETASSKFMASWLKKAPKASASPEQNTKKGKEKEEEEEDGEPEEEKEEEKEEEEQE